jgi:hypothetical protein
MDGPKVPVDSRGSRAVAIQAAVAFLAANGRFNPYLSGDILRTGEAVMDLADRFYRFIEVGMIVTDSDAFLPTPPCYLHGEPRPSAQPKDPA